MNRPVFSEGSYENSSGNVNVKQKNIIEGGEVLKLRENDKMDNQGREDITIRMNMLILYFNDNIR